MADADDDEPTGRGASARSVDARAARLGALADPARLAIVDELWTSDRAPVELRRRIGIESNLLAHHLDVLERAGLIERSRSSGDGRRRYVHLHRTALEGLLPGPGTEPQRALFVCTRNSARSRLAAALWTSMTGSSATSAGTHPADRVDPGAIAAAGRAGLVIDTAPPRTIDDLGELPDLVVTVCDQAHEDLDPPPTWLHWSVPDPVADGRDEAFDAAVIELRTRIADAVTSPAPGLSGHHGRPSR